jgi:serine protease AprX
LVCTFAGANAFAQDHPKLDRVLNKRASQAGQSRVIVMLKPGWVVETKEQAKLLGGKLGHNLGLINGTAVELSNGQLKRLADYPGVERIIYDRPTAGELNRVAVTVGARNVQQSWGYRGAGVGVAVLDSGITSWHNDLTYSGASLLVKTLNSQRVAGFVDFVNGRTTPYDDNGHGTHVAGIINGNGYDSLGSRAGIAPDAHIVSLKVLDQNGRGVISSVIAALEWVITNRAAYNVRVINLSVGAAVSESYKTDPLTLAAKRAVDAGIVVVTAAGNSGKNSLGQPLYGAITAPGNAPWVLTVGASNHEGTVSRADDTMADFSSRGPSAVDYEAKPDIVAPGVGTASLSDPLSLMYTTKSTSLLSGSLLTATKPYLSLSGTSMSAPVVAGSVALMLEANPALTPNLVKALLEYTAQTYGYSALAEGAGFLNTKGAVELARYFHKAQVGQAYPQASQWSKKLIWGSHRISQGVIKPKASAWKIGVVWGAAKDLAGANIAWGTFCGSLCGSVVWTSADSEDNIVWGTVSASEDNIVWGTYAETSDDNVVWGTASDDEDNIVWGTDCGGADCAGVVWGAATGDEDNIVWGTADDEDNIVWGTASDEDNIVWGTADAEDNIVWGTASDEDNIVWGTASDEDNVTWGTSGADTTLFESPDAPPVNYDSSVYDELFAPTTTPTTTPVTTPTTTPEPTPTTTLPGGGVL